MPRRLYAESCMALGIDLTKEVWNEGKTNTETHRKARTRWPELSDEEAEAPWQQCILLYTFEQGGGVIAYIQTRRLGHYLQIKVEVMLFTQLNKEVDLTSLSLCGGVVFWLEISSEGVGWRKL